MSNRKQIEQLRGEFVRVPVLVDGDLELSALGYQNYPTPTYYELRINGESVCGWCDSDCIASNAFQLDMITSDQMWVIEDAISRFLDSNKW
jgi:hypothetical protein